MIECAGAWSPPQQGSESPPQPAELGTGGVSAKRASDSSGTGGRPGAWWFFVPVLLVASLLPRWLPQPESAWRLKLGGLLGFVPFFLYNSIKGGWDVARRALLPGPRLEPGLYHHQLRLPSETARIFLPGNEPIKHGEIVTQADLAATLGSIQRRGWREFY